MAGSIIQNEKRCYITGWTVNLHKHHIFGGGRRKASEQYGLWVWLRADWHNLSNYGVHFNKELDMLLKQKGQEAFERDHTRAEFRKIFGRNYL